MHENNHLHAHSALSRIRNYLGSHSLRYFAGAIAVILAVVTMMLPSAYTVEGPGPTQDVLGSSSGSDVISISGAETHKDSGKLLLVTVNAAGVPGYPVTNAQALAAWLDPKQTVMPQEVVFPVGKTRSTPRNPPRRWTHPSRRRPMPRSRILRARAWTSPA